MRLWHGMAWGVTWLVKDPDPWSQFFPRSDMLAHTEQQVWEPNFRRSAVSTYLLSNLPADSHKLHTAVLIVFLDVASNSGKLYGGVTFSQVATVTGY